MKPSNIFVRVSKELKEKIRAGAEKQGRSMSNFICWILEQFFKK